MELKGFKIVKAQFNRARANKGEEPKNTETDAEGYVKQILFWVWVYL